jgi:hypothetical protein
MKVPAFIVKLIFFLLPVAAINLLLIGAGFTYSPKTNTVINHLINQPKSADEYRIAFLGTSRTNLSISPDDLIEGIGKRSKKISVLNFGMDGLNTSALFPSVREAHEKFDLIFIEILPVGDLLADTNSLNNYKFPCQVLDDWLWSHASKGIVLTKSWEVMMYIAHRSPIHYLNCHSNGWTEVRAGTNTKALAKAKGVRMEIVKKRSRHLPTQQGILNFCWYIKTFFDQKNTQVAFIIMPVSGPVLNYQEDALRKSRLLSFIKKKFPDSIFIDGQSIVTTPPLTFFDNSHTDNFNATRFSYQLGKHLGGILKGL